MSDGAGEPDGNDKLGRELGARMPHLLGRLARSLRASYSELGTSPGQYPVLAALATRPGQTVSELAGRSGVRLPSMTVMVGQMEAEGLVIKEADPGDRRVVRVALTDRGRELALAAMEARTRWFAARLAHLSSAEVAAIARAIPALEHLAGTEG